jgi:hypothetical protein
LSDRLQGRRLVELLLSAWGTALEETLHLAEVLNRKFRFCRRVSSLERPNTDPDLNLTLMSTPGRGPDGLATH